MARIITLKENRDFRRLYGRGKCFASPALVTYVTKNREGRCRVGITASKKIGNAVQRNRARRVITAAYRAALPRITGGYDFVFVARTRTRLVRSNEVLSTMLSHLAKANCLATEQNDEKTAD